MSTLYICPTPIGNLEDITLRVLRILKEVSCIAAEDTRHARKLLEHYDIKTSLMYYDDHHGPKGITQIEKLLSEGKDVALISDAGTPLISDPGIELVRYLKERGFQIVSLPGANAAITALVASGLDATKFEFVGFLPRKSAARRTALSAMVFAKRTIILYESVHRITKTLEDIASVYGKRKIVVARELTKSYEEFLEGSAEEILGILEGDPQKVKGEFVILLSGYQEEDKEMNIQEELLKYLESGIDKKSAVGIIAKEFKIPKREVYKAALDIESTQSSV